MNPVSLKKDKVNPSERVNEMILGFEQVKWFEVAEWLECDDTEGLHYTYQDGMVPVEITPNTRVRFLDLANYKWYLKKNQ